MSDDENALPIIEEKLVHASRNYPTKTLDILSQFYFKQQKYEERRIIPQKERTK